MFLLLFRVFQYFLHLILNTEDHTNNVIKVLIQTNRHESIIYSKARNVTFVYLKLNLKKFIMYPFGSVVVIFLFCHPKPV